MELTGKLNRDGVQVIKDYAGPGQDRVVFRKTLTQGGRRLTKPFHLTAARWRLCVNVRGHGWAAAGDRRELAIRDIVGGGRETTKVAYLGL
jgi:hypothetical protein